MTDVLIIGDSISIGYMAPAAEALGGRFRVTHNESNAADSRSLLAKLDAYLAAAPAAEIIHFNCGLHDLRQQRDDGTYHVALDAYRENLLRIVDRSAATGAKLIWGRTTPIHDARHEATHDAFDRREADVQAYNAAADKIVAAAGIAIDDLHAAVLAAGIDDCIRDDGVHMTDWGYGVLGRHVAEAIRRVNGQ